MEIETPLPDDEEGEAAENHEADLEGEAAEEEDDLEAGAADLEEGGGEDEEDKSEAEEKVKNFLRCFCGFFSHKNTQGPVSTFINFS
jgi:hypothetical protein